MRKAGVLLILLLAARGLSASPVPRTVLVVPFDNLSARQDLGWISESFAEILSSRLASPERLVLGRRERNAACEQLEIPPGTSLTLASIYKVAERLGADWVITGSFSAEGAALSASAQLLDARQLKLAPRLEVAGELSDLIELQTRLAWRLLATRDPDFTVGQEEDFGRKFPPVRLDAFENYIRGVLAKEPERRVRYLEEADRLNPADRLAAFELGRDYFEQKDYENSARWFRKLQKQDRNYPEALFYLGVDEFFLGRDAAAERAFAELSAEMPLNEVWNNLGMMQARGGRVAEAAENLARAYQGDPTDPVFCFNLGVCLWRLNRHKEAAQVLQEALRLVGDDTEAHWVLADTLGKLGDSAGRQLELHWLALNEGNGEATSSPVPHLRLKKNYDGRAFRLLTVAVSKAREARLQAAPLRQPKSAPGGLKP